MKNDWTKKILKIIIIYIKKQREENLLILRTARRYKG